jgi:hypothetical protein
MRELSVAEQRYLAVLAVIEGGVPVTASTPGRPAFALPMRRGLSTSHSRWRRVTVMTAPDDARTRWPDGGSPGYQDLPEPVALEETIALHPAGPAEPQPDWSAGFGDLGDGGDGDG